MLALIAWFVSAVVGAIIGAEKGKTGKGALLGFFFGPIGWILMMMDVGVIGFSVLIGIIIGCGYILAYMIQTREKSAQTAPPAVAAATPVPTPVTRIDPTPISTTTDKLALIRGEITGEAGGVLTVRCLPDPEPPQWNVGAAGAAEIAQLARQATEQKKKLVEREYGPLISPNGFTNDNVSGFARPSGTVAVRGCRCSGNTINLIAANTGETAAGAPLYAADFILANKTKPAQADSQFPEGVDTPEQRREFLIRRIEAQKALKQSAAPPALPRPTANVRGY